MNTQQLQCFVAVADKLSFTKAAQELYFSVPSVTHHIRQLEAELEAQLFIRNQKLVKLTDMGAAFYPYAKEMLRQQDLATQSLTRQSSHGHISIGCTSNAELVMLTEVLGKFRLAFPDMEPVVEIETYDKLLLMLGAGQIDFMLASSHMRKGTDFSFLELVKMKSYAIVARSHPLAGQKEIRFSQLENERLILPHSKLIPFQSDNPLRDLVNLHRLHHRDFFIEDDRVCLSLAGAGYGAAVLPGYRIPEYFEVLDLSCIPILENEDFPYGILYKDLPPEKKLTLLVREMARKLSRRWPPAEK